MLVMHRPTNEEFADARDDIQRFLAANPRHELAPALRVALRRTAPPTKAEAIPIMVKHSNEGGGWPSQADDEQRAMAAIMAAKPMSTWDASNWAQWKTLVYFMGGGT